MLPNDGPGLCSYDQCSLRRAQNCIESICKKHCQLSAARALEANIPRQSCKLHQVEAVQDILPPFPYAHVTAAEAAIMLPQIQAQRQATAAITVQQPVRSPRRTQSSPKRPTKATNGRASSTRSLAQPMGPLWRDQSLQAEQKKISIQNQKARRLELDDRDKKTVQITLYYKVCDISCSIIVHWTYFMNSGSHTSAAA